MTHRVGLVFGAGLIGLLAACSSTTTGSGGSSGPGGGSSGPGDRTSASGETSDSGGTSAGPESMLDPCSLLTHEQASEIIGERAKPGSRNNTICRWDSTMGSGPVIKIEVWPGAAYDREAKRVPPSGVTQATVDGVGDEAFAADVGRMGHLLWFRKGDVSFKVDALAVRGRLKDLDAEKQVALYMLQNL